MPDADLIPTLLAAYEAHLDRRLRELGVAPEAARPAIDRGRDWLEHELTELLATPFHQQRRGVLELVQAAMAPVTEALEGLGTPPIARDQTALSAIPGDLYGLAPASSQELGEDAWRAHMAWGIEKAQAMTSPSPGVVAWYGSNLMDRSKIEGAVRAHGFELAAYRNPGACPAGALRVFVDLEAPDSDSAIAAAATAGVTVIAYGPHVDDVAMIRARSLGADEAVPRSAFFRRLAEFLPVVA